MNKINAAYIIHGVQLEDVTTASELYLMSDSLKHFTQEFLQASAVELQTHTSAQKGSPLV